MKRIQTNKESDKFICWANDRAKQQQTHTCAHCVLLYINLSHHNNENVVYRNGERKINQPTNKIVNEIQKKNYTKTCKAARKNHSNWILHR